MLRCFALLLCLIVLAGCGGDKPAAPKQQSKVRLPPGAEILAADLYRLNGETLRLANASVPQPAPAAKCWAEAVLAAQAASQVRGWSVNGFGADEIRRVGTDVDGATRVIVSWGEEDVGEMLIAAGYAAQWTAGGWDWCSTPPDVNDPRGPSLGVVNDFERLMNGMKAGIDRTP